jgi:peptide/nickel transport system permease protein
MALPTVFGVTIVCFALVRLLPGNPAYLIAGPYASDRDVQQVVVELGLDRPLHEQYFTYLGNLVRGDLGRAWFTSKPVAHDLAERFPATFELANLSLAIAFGLGIPLGVLAAVRQGTWVDHLTRVLSILGVSTPLFCSGLLFIFFFYSELQIAPPPMGRLGVLGTPPPTVTGMYLIDSAIAGEWDTFRTALSHLVLPSLTLGISMLAPILRMVRSSMLEVLRSRYVKAAMAYGLPQREVLYRHALKNALLPIITTVAVFYGFALSGMVLVETIFSWPGIGLYAINAILNSDYAAIQGIVVFVTLIYVTLYIVVDCAYALIDPRVAY